MSFGFLAGTLDSTQIGSSLVASYSYQAGHVVDTILPAAGADVLSVLTCFYIPQIDFSPTTVMTLPTALATVAEGGVRFTASGGNIPVTILIFGR